MQFCLIGYIRLQFVSTCELETNPMTICKIAKSITADDNNQSNVTSDKRLMGF